MRATPLKNTSSSRTFRFTVEQEETNTSIERASKILSRAHAIKGFRPGEAPFSILIKTLPKHIVYKAILNQAVSLIVKKLSQIDEKWFSSPLIEYKGFEEKNHTIHLDMPLEFIVTLANEPLVTIPSYRDIKTRQEKTATNLVKARDELLEKIRNKSVIDIAPFLIEREAEAIISQQIEEVKAHGLNFDEYVENIAKDREDFLARMRQSAEVNIKNWLILKKIAQDEHVEITDDEREKRIQEIFSSLSNPQEAITRLNSDILRQRVSDELLQEKIFATILDKQIITN